jgi:hypothetical protein
VVRLPALVSFYPKSLTLALFFFFFLRADGSLEAQSRSHATRKLRNKLGGTPPPPVLPFPAAVDTNAHGAAGGALALATAPIINPLSLSVDEIPSPFPLPLAGAGSGTGHGSGGSGGTQNNGTGAGNIGAGGASTHGGRRRPKGGGAQRDAGGGLGKSLALLQVGCKDVEVEADLLEIRRGNKRRRATAAALVKAATGG